jgi:hypothetical protein
MSCCRNLLPPPEILENENLKDGNIPNKMPKDLEHRVWLQLCFDTEVHNCRAISKNILKRLEHKLKTNFVNPPQPLENNPGGPVFPSLDLTRWPTIPTWNLCGFPRPLQLQT